ncbi:sulfur carrier protein ThiS [Paraglaciecola polaris]|uniref:Sulfur carrier protein n=1 Tax=Paraglaciecola polaris LMG 21857 TaxID=1129793 RepID=K7AEZ7_9ALTE|nr:sulfur carrier protein ThiS [Paraglaciecola polaris]GAC33865.1 sulfur carrier protein [Paraglaciecola polaris LMG 21857]|tara:strand:+ start:10941 stop:11138 length:198 start_codon:yes stop_codon:yes gene_type:complete
MLTILFNGEPYQVRHAALLLVLDELKVSGVCAVAVNGQFVPKIEHENVTLNDKDTIDAFTPMQGG